MSSPAKASRQVTRVQDLYSFKAVMSRSLFLSVNTLAKLQTKAINGFANNYHIQLGRRHGQPLHLNLHLISQLRREWFIIHHNENTTIRYIPGREYKLPQLFVAHFYLGTHRCAKVLPAIIYSHRRRSTALLRYIVVTTCFCESYLYRAMQRITPF